MTLKNPDVGVDYHIPKFTTVRGPQLFIACVDEGYIDFLNGSVGISLDTWNPGRPQLKNGGVWAESPFIQGSQLVSSQLTDITTVLTLYITGCDDEELQDRIRWLTRFLNRARSFWTTEHLSSPVYIGAQEKAISDCRYAIVKNYKWMNDPDSFSPTMSSQTETKIAEQVVISITHGLWQSEPPRPCLDEHTKELSPYPYEIENMEIPNKYNQEFDSRDLGPSGMSAVGDASIEEYGFIANKHGYANISTLLRYDASGPSYTEIIDTPGYLFPYPITVGDMLYAGCETSLDDDGQFSNLVFTMNDGAGGALTNMFILEYWNGSAWATMTNVNNRTSLSTYHNPTGAANYFYYDAGNVSLQGNTFSINWIPPSNWATTSVNGVTAWWVRFRITTAVANPPAQSDQTYSCLWPVYQTDLNFRLPWKGLSLLCEAHFQNDSCSSIPADHAIHKIYIGARSTYRCLDDGLDEEFFSHINMSDNVPSGFGPTISKGSSTSWTNAHDAPTGRCISYTGSAVVDLARIFLDFYYMGRYRIFLRYHHSSGSVGDVAFHLKIYPSGGDYYETEEHVPKNNNDWQLADFGIHNLLMTTDNQGRAIQAPYIDVYVDCGGTNTVYIYDVILIPVDEWSAEFTCPPQTEGSINFQTAIAGGTTGIISSTGNQKHSIIGWRGLYNYARAIICNTAGKLEIPCLSYGQNLTGADAIKDTYRYYMLFSTFSGYIDDIEETSHPTILAKIKLHGIAQYDTFRGSA